MAAMLALGAIFILSVFKIPDVNGQCHPDWQYHDGSCYAIGELALTWTSAQEMCRSYNAKLAEIQTSAENEYLKNMARVKLAGSWYWIGGSDVFHEGSWTWASTSEPIYDFTDWAPGQPDGTDGRDCLTLYAPDDYKWHDTLCESSQVFICEGSPIEPVVG